MRKPVSSPLGSNLWPEGCNPVPAEPPTTSNMDGRRRGAFTTGPPCHYNAFHQNQDTAARTVPLGRTDPPPSPLQGTRERRGSTVWGTIRSIAIRRCPPALRGWRSVGFRWQGGAAEERKTGQGTSRARHRPAPPRPWPFLPATPASTAAPAPCRKKGGGNMQRRLLACRYLNTVATAHHLSTLLTKGTFSEG